ncbi:ABC transporter permease [Kluyvera genomosp. 1]|uniref:ABC transporter permease n=1 Tax=Kluyvera genomosp. 1 TaxID=2774053 RepID=UPI00068F7107|nr:ABC transporter permease [Kluyvera genomosp. 1]
MARSGLEVQKAVIKALFMREIKTRFGKYRLGYLWAVLEPAAHLLILLTIFGYIMKKTMPDISFPVFILNGLIPYFIFTNISNRSIKAIDANSGLFNYKPVKPIDTIFARAILESFIYVSVYIFLMALVGLLGEEYEVNQIIDLVMAWFCIIIFACGVGTIFMVIGKTFRETEKFLPILLKPLYFISCIMFPLHSIPEEYRKYILINPIVHAVEISRESVVAGYSSAGVSMWYLAFSSLLTFFIGIVLYEFQEEAMLTS